MNTSEICEILAAWAVSKPLVLRLFIFGSRVRGDYRPDSDIDIAIELDMSAADGVDDSGGLATFMFEADDWEQELQAHFSFNVDLEQFRGPDTPTIEKALRQSSILVFQKDNQGSEKG
jgi:uncharacterized protein